jgi:hypothetical protein
VAKHRDEDSTQPHQPVIRINKTAPQNAKSLISQNNGAQQKAARPITLSTAASLAEMRCGFETPYHRRPVNPRTALRSNAPTSKRCQLGTFDLAQSLWKQLFPFSVAMCETSCASSR